MRIAVRGYVGEKLLFEDRVDIEDDMQAIEALATSHAKRLMDYPHTVEIEFLDEPDPNARFFRFGTQTTGMVGPVAIDLNKFRP